MLQIHLLRATQVASSSLFALLLLIGPASTSAQTAANAASGATGRIDFASADLPPATVEMDLSQEIFSDLFGLGDAAIAGVIESLTQSNAQTNGAQNSKATELAAEQLAAGRQIMQLAKEVVREVHVRVYKNFDDQQRGAAELAVRFDQQLASGHWDKVIKIRDGNKSVHMSLLRVEGSILGVFVIVADGKDVVLANVICDVSPENIKQLTAAATKIGLELGLRDAIEREMKHLLH